MGFSLRGPISRSGFGFFHDGRVDTLTSFLQDGFDITSDQDTADIIAFLLGFTGSDLPPGSVIDVNRAPGLPSRDAHAAVGFQTTVTNNVSNQRTLFMMAQARLATARVDLVLHGFKDGQQRAWLMRGTQFISDKSETNSSTQVLALASPQTPLTFTMAPLGSGTRLALDRDGDGFFNRIEIEAGADPNDPSITPDTTTPRLTSFRVDSGEVRMEWFGKIGSNYRIQTRATLSADTSWSDHSDAIPIASNPASWSEPIETGNKARFYQIVHVP